MRINRLLLFVLLSSSLMFGAIDLVWQQSTSPGVTSNNVYRSQVSGGPYDKVFASTGRIATWTDTSPITGEFYCYVVTAIGPDGESVYSNEACVTAGTKAPTLLKAK